jgi:hypothetical protein
MKMKESKKMRLEIEKIKVDVLGGLSEFEIKFENMEQLRDAVAAINRFYEEQNSFIRDSYEVAKTNAEAFISQWKITHSKKVQLVHQDKENKRQEQLKKTKEALKLIPTLQRQHNDFIETIERIQLLDKYVLKDAYPYNSPYRKDTNDILKEVQNIVNNTIEASKGAK